MKRFNYKFGQWLFPIQQEQVNKAWSAFLNKQSADVRYCSNKAFITPVAGGYFKLSKDDNFETFLHKKLVNYFKRVKFSNRYFEKGRLSNLDDITECSKQLRAQDKEDEREYKKLKAESNKILKNVDTYMSYGLLIGVNYEEASARYEDFNKIEVIENEEKYSNSCKYKRIVRYVRVSIKRGYSLHNVGSIYTIVRGDKIDRKGMPCVWCEQGNAYSDTKMVSGYLVRGEHIEAKTLKQALKISEEHRAKALEKALSNRQFKAVQRERLQSVMVSINDSIEGGNCMPGTMNFKHRIEEELGEEINELSAEQVLYYGKKFGLLLYAERAVKVALNKK